MKSDKRPIFIFSIFTSFYTQKYGIITYGVDLSRFSDKGFIISTTDKNQRYSSVAIVTSECVSGVDKAYAQELEENNEDDIFDNELYYGNYRVCLLA